MRRLVPWLLREKRLIAATAALATVNQLLLLAEPQIIRLLVDSYALRAHAMATSAFLTGVVKLLAIASGIALVARVARSNQDYYANLAAHRVAGRLYAESLEQSVLLPWSRVEETSSGALLQKLQRARTDVQLLLSRATYAYLAAVALLAVTIYAATIHWLIAVTVLTMPLALAALLLGISYPIARQQRQIAASITNLAGSTTETFRNLELIKSIGAEREELARLESRHDALLDLEARKLTLIRRHALLEGTILNAARALLMLLMLWLLYRGAVTVGQFVTMFLYSLTIFSPLALLGDMIVRYHETGVSLAEIAELAGAPREHVHTAPSLQSIALRDVSFRYPNAESDAVRNVSLRVARGETIALIGPSGSGKTTIVKLLIGLTAPASGEVLFNDRPATEAEFAALRKRIGIVTQDTQLFAGTVRENLLLAKPSATDDECREALAQAAFPVLLDARIGEGGLTLSGGERQRVAIARALLRDPEVLVFDEPTSMLDPATEAAIVTTMRALAPGRINVIVSHRLAATTHADRIYEVSGARVV